MKWYVRHEDGEVWGPMEKGEAEDMRDQMDDACMFDERIFSPQFVTTPEVEQALRGLREMKEGQKDISYWADKAGIARIQCQNAIDTIVLLSREKLVTGRIEGGVLDLDKVPAGVTVDIRDYDVEGAGDEFFTDEAGDNYVVAG